MQAQQERLFRAITQCNEQIVKELLDNNADISISFNYYYGMTPLYAALDQIDDDGSEAAFHRTPELTRQRCQQATNIVRMLIAGSDVNARNVDCLNMTAFMFALRKRIDTDVIVSMLHAGADTKAVDEDGWTPLMLAVASRCSADTVRILLAADSSVINETGADGKTALLMAIDRGDVEVVGVLLGVKGLEVDIPECRQAASDAPNIIKAEVNECLQLVAATVIQRHWREYSKRVAATVIQRHWRECYYNPRYLVCQRRLMEEGEAMEGELKRLK